MEADIPVRLDRNAWIDAAYGAFESGGVQAVRIDPLSKALGVTRGSFYWHFKDHPALMVAVLEKWHAANTESIIAANESAEGSAADRLLRLLKTCASDDGHLEMGVRAWAVRDQVARTAVERIDACRIKYMSDLIEAAGAARADAHPRARVAYLAWLGSYTDAVPTSVDQRIADMDYLLRMMLAK
jgi:AcrR family transcriptional regulator